MENRQIEFLTSAVKPSQYPAPDRPEIALAGRSNVGKSSFINSLFARKKLARTSSKPGKTRVLNYYELAERCYFVDVPGYGYARVSKKEKAAWQEMLTTYFAERSSLVLTFLLVDFRHQPSKEDVLMKESLDTWDIPYFIIATKADKVKKGQWQKQLNLLKTTLSLVTTEQILPYSSISHTGRAEAWEIIEGILAEEGV